MLTVASASFKLLPYVSSTYNIFVGKDSLRVTLRKKPWIRTAGIEIRDGMVSREELNWLINIVRENPDAT